MFCVSLCARSFRLQSLLHLNRFDDERVKPKPKTNKEYSEYLILACLNSKLLNWYYQNIVNNEVGEALAQVKRGI
jgi:hypothetical protein